MGVRCTLLGHDYGDSEIEREREESGDEAVVTIREVRICQRCGNKSVRSENKEVTSVAPPSEGAPAADESAESPDPAAVNSADETGTGPEHDPETDDGVILEDENDEEPGERQYGEWPDADEDHGSAEADPRAGVESEPREWPDAEGDDEGYDASTPTGEDPDVEYPRAPEDEADLESPAGTGDSERAGAGSDLQRVGEAAPPAGPTTEGTELHCPSCGYRDPSRDGSLREGDICPECKKGYLAATD